VLSTIASSACVLLDIGRIARFDAGGGPPSFITKTQFGNQGRER